VDLSRVDRRADESTLSLVIIDPLGERTIINLSRASVPLPADLANTPCDIAYIRSADPLLTPLLGRMVRRIPVLTHIPPIEGLQRPATILLGSTSDLDDTFLADPFARGREIAGTALEWVVITDGAKGATAYGASDSHQVTAPSPGQVIDSTGAGDAFAAGLIHALGAGESIQQALARGNRWGAASVTYPGTIPPPGFPET
jgi:sugar/nucleoside kinase (ribokinase family)